MVTLAQGKATMQSPLEHTHDGGSWHNWCASFVCRFVTGVDSAGGGLGDSADTAYDALLSSGPIISLAHQDAPAGTIGWYKSSGSKRPGHVAVSLGADVWAMASDAAGNGWGEASGPISWQSYRAKKPTMIWLGWTFDYVGQHLSDTKVIVKQAGRRELYLLTGATSRHHLTPEEYAPLKARHTPVFTVGDDVLHHYSEVS